MREGLTELVKFPFLPEAVEFEGYQHCAEQDDLEVLYSRLSFLSSGHVPRRAGGNLGCN